MNGQRVVVAGGSSGIGEATAQAFVAAGATVLITGRDAGRLEEARARVGAAGASSVDGASAQACRRFFEGIEPIDHLVLCLSGGKGAGPLATLDLADIRSGLEAKLFAQLNMLQAALPKLTRSIIFVSAVSARAALTGTAGLAAINGAIEALVRPLAAELAPLRVNAVSPGVIDTPWWDALPPSVKADHFRGAAATLPVKRVGRPEDVASAILLLAQNGFMTGTVLEVDGGAHLAR